VQPFPSTGAKQQVSNYGAFLPFWSPDGRELFFNSRTLGLAAVGVTTQPSFNFGIPTAIPVRFFTQQTTWPRNIDIAPDGKRFIAVLPSDQSGAPAAQQIEVVLNWFTELQQRAPVK
jgi:Tol biopolymer transport system component